jgi:opacity protein-like surface antigen
MLNSKFWISGAAALGCMIVSTPAFAQAAYIRADLGWSGSTGANIHDRNFNLDRAITGPNGSAGFLNDLGSGWLAGVGVGFSWPQWLRGLRGDVTYTYRGQYNLDELDGNTPPTLFKSDVHSHAVMASAYWDFPFEGSFSGFLGLGLGWSEVSFGNVQATSTLSINPLATTVGPATTAFAPGGNQDNFAWQFMAGVSFPFDKSVAMDLFYRYFDGGHFVSDPGNVLINGNVVGTYAGAEGALHAHEFVASVRFALN